MVPLPMKCELSDRLKPASVRTPLASDVCCTPMAMLDEASRLAESKLMVAPLASSPNSAWVKLLTKFCAKSTVALPSEATRCCMSSALLDSLDKLDAVPACWVAGVLAGLPSARGAAGV